jgi:GntR family transcriptional regulator/MocR family aminotransferase
VTARVGAGTFVNEHGAPVRNETKRRQVEGALRPLPIWDSIPLSTAFARPAQFDFRTGVPDASLFPHDKWRRLMSRQLRSEAVRAGVYGDPAGHRGLREAIARHIGVARGVEAAADDVTVVNGTQQALDVVARVLLAPGDRVAVEARVTGRRDGYSSRSASGSPAWGSTSTGSSSTPCRGMRVLCM